MADVTISSLPLGTPSGNALLPYSTGSNTLGVPTSAIFQNISTGIGINCKPESSETKLFIRSGYPDSYLFGLSGTSKSSAMYLLVDVDNKRQTCITDSNGARTLVFDNSVPGQTNTQFWNNNTEAIRINSSNNVGIGTINPTAKLDVAGDVKATNTAKAWVRFNGTGTIGQNQTIIASYNVSSVIKLTENNYVVNFPAGVFSNGNYSFYGMSGTSTNRASFLSGPLIDEPTATAFRFGSFSLVYTGQPAGIINEAGQYINIMFFAN